MQAQKELARRQARELDRLAELERFQRLTVGRELKMIELKKEIEYLKKQTRPTQASPMTGESSRTRRGRAGPQRP